MFIGFTRLQYSGGVLRGAVCEDLARYYRSLYYYDSFRTVRMFSARYGTHITVYNRSFHGIRSGAQAFHDRVVSFYYDPREIYRGGQNKGFIGFYLPVYSTEIKAIQNALGFDDTELNRSLHISLFNNKHDVK